MFSMFLVILYFAFRAAVVAQSSPSILCVAGQCLQGYSSTTIGAKLTASGEPMTIQLLPGQYTTTTNPQLLHNYLTSSGTLVGSPGFQSGPLPSLPLSLRLQPGLAIYPQSLYSGQPSYGQLPSSPLNTSTPLPGNSIAISSNVWVAVSSNNQRIILWDSIPDISHLPYTGSLSLLDIQSTTCSPPCSGSGVCSASGNCTCSTGFNGTSCELCADNFFGPTCQPCPQGCSNCDQGISGSGRCLSPIAEVLPSSCNCLNGICGSNGQCTCNIGWTTSTNGTACAECAPGFFLTQSGDCQVCPLGCSQCADSTGCTSCNAGFTHDNTQCVPTPAHITGSCVNETACSTTSCPKGTFGSGNHCSPCSPSCSTCNGPTSNDCTLCATGTYFFNGNCVPTDGDGVCQGTNGMIANNGKGECDTCGAKCTSCKIPGFYASSTMNQLQCTGCLPGLFLSKGSCGESCPSGTYVSPQDNVTCTACSSSCSTCIGSPNFCLTCPNGQVASSGTCVSTCPSNTFLDSGSCLNCHPDCSTCSGSSFDQCNSCPSSRPVLTSGRCLPTCSKAQYFDTATSTCQACDSSCSSCSGPASDNCLACSSSTQVLRGGSCVGTNCQGSSTVIPGLGVCLSELVQVASASAPLPSVSGLAQPTVITKTLVWWEILLMALGCAFIFIVILWCWRRRARIRREKRTKTFAREKNLDNPQSWRWRLIQFGERLFGHRRKNLPSELPMSADLDLLHSPTIRPIEHDDIKLRNMMPSHLESKGLSRMKRESISDVISTYEHSDYSRHSRTSSEWSMVRRHKEEYTSQLKARIQEDTQSVYSEMTGNRRWTSEPRHSPRKDLVSLRSSIGSSIFLSAVDKEPATTEDDVNRNGGQQAAGNLTDAQAYMMAVKPTITGAPSQNQSFFPIPTYAPVRTFAPPPIGAGVVPQFMGGNLMPMPVTLTGNGQGSYWLASVPTIPPQAQVTHPPISQPMDTGGSYPTASSHNPFRKGYP